MKQQFENITIHGFSFKRHSTNGNGIFVVGLNIAGEFALAELNGDKQYMVGCSVRSTNFQANIECTSNAKGALKITKITAI